MGVGWRRYARDGGAISDLNDLVRSDCTSRNPRRVAASKALNDLEQRIAELAREDARKAEQPEIDGDQVIAHLESNPVPMLDEPKILVETNVLGTLGEAAALERLDAWWAKHRNRPAISGR